MDWGLVVVGRLACSSDAQSYVAQSHTSGKVTHGDQAWEDIPDKPWSNGWVVMETELVSLAAFRHKSAHKRSYCTWVKMGVIQQLLPWPSSPIYDPLCSPLMVKELEQVP